jgi:hypothetical protein
MRSKLESGLPVGRKQKYQFRYVVGLGVENVGIFNDQLEYFV